ncbi:zinc finger protein pita-like [Armigeres subalbatus]|uniref:zinc finger protein pita-like n=1 Tax=Armigeres subalbatus TaxID=124917 RepID=UPI002ED3628F
MICYGLERMIPESILENNPTMGQLSKELEEKKVCRICLIETECRISQQWNTVLTTCFTASSLIAEKLPKFVCQECSDFLEKCNQFKEMCRKSELILMSYPLTGTLPSRVEVPNWLRPITKRKQDAISEAPEKRICSEQCPGTAEVRPTEVLPIDCTLQSPTITSEIGVTPEKTPTEALPNMEVPITVNQLQQPLNPNQSTVIQQMQTYVTTYQHPAPQYQYQPQTLYVPPVQQNNKFPLLQHQLQQPVIKNGVNQQVLIPLVNPNQQAQQIVPQQIPTLQPYQQPSQQPMSTFKPPQPSLAYQTIQPSRHPATQQPAQPSCNSSTTAVVQCKACAYLFASRHHLVAHMRKHLGSAEYRCACGRHFHQMHAYVNHLKQHSTISWCDLCGKQFPVQNAWELGAHLDQHVHTGLHEACDFCPLVFVDLQSRLQHVRTKHEEELRQLMQLNRSKHKGDGGWI